MNANEYKKGDNILIDFIDKTSIGRVVKVEDWNVIAHIPIYNEQRWVPFSYIIRKLSDEEYDILEFQEKL